MRVVGTAGHVDHGKSTLIEALTGTHPDRLKEERAREMTIDLGFGWITLPDGETVGIVDVPGHRDFIENMLAGVGGIDAALFIVAADEGVMPQTREHLAILDLLQIQGGVVVLTKTDLVDEPEWLDLVEIDVRQTLQGTFLQDAPLVRVSARTGAGLPELLTALTGVLEHQSKRLDLGRPRLPVDRVFSRPGFGTVVTGTLTDGVFRIGDEVEVLPEGIKGRVRGLQSHNRKLEEAVPGSRVAINVSGVEVDQILRGNVLAHPGRYAPSRMLDVHFRSLADLSAPLRHNQEVKLFIGAAEVIARMRLLGAEELAAGQSGWLQLELREPVVALRGDRYILRRPSPGETLGGGEVVDPHPKERHRRFADDLIAQLEAYRRGSPAEVFFQASLAAGPAQIREVNTRARLDRDQASEAIGELADSGQIIFLEEGEGGAGNLDRLIIARPHWEALRAQIGQTLNAYHQSFPLRAGLSREELKSRLKYPAKVFNAIIHKAAIEGILEESGAIVRRPGFTVHFNPQQETRIKTLMERFAAAPFSPPTLKETQAEVGEPVTAALIETGRLAQVSPEVVFRKEDYDRMLAWVRAALQSKPALTVAEFRDQFSTSRRYALAFLEHLDAIGVTMREGDNRRLRK